MFDRLKTIGVAFTLLGALAIPMGALYWSIDAVESTAAVEAA